MTTEHWVAAAKANDALVAELLLRMKQYSSPSTAAAATTSTWLPPIGWGHRKSRSKLPAAAVAAVTATSGFMKEQQRGSPTTPLSWSGGGGGWTSTSDAYDEASRPLDLSSGGRSNKGVFANEGAATSSYKMSTKRKSFAELKEEEGFLLKERTHLNRELASVRVTLNQQIATSDSLKKLKIDLHQNTKRTMLDNEPRTSTMVNQSVQTSCKVKAVTKPQEMGFVLPDLNMTPADEEPEMMS